MVDPLYSKRMNIFLVEARAFRLPLLSDGSLPFSISTDINRLSPNFYDSSGNKSIGKSFNIN